MAGINLSPKEEKELLLKTVSSSPFAVIVGSVLATFLIAAIFIKVGGPVPISVTQTSLEKSASFDISGVGKTEVVPDIARTNLGMTVSRTRVTEAQNAANEVINTLKQDLKNLGVQEKDIRTISYNINPEYSFDGGQQRVIGYSVATQLEVIFRDFNQLNTALDKAVENGANLVGGLTFDLSDEKRKEAQNKALTEAVKNAKEQAVETAKLAGINLGKIINIYQEPFSDFPPYPRTALSIEAKGEDVAQTEVSPGISEVKVQVTLSYETR